MLSNRPPRTGSAQPSVRESEMEGAREEDSKCKDLSPSKTQVLKVTQLNSESRPEEAYARGSRKVNHRKNTLALSLVEGDTQKCNDYNSSQRVS